MKRPGNHETQGRRHREDVDSIATLVVRPEIEVTDERVGHDVEEDADGEEADR